MIRLYTLLLSLFLISPVFSQSIVVSGKCINAPVVLNKEPNTVEGKVAYTGTGTVLGIANVAISIFWIGVPDNVWVLAFDGQPYFKNSCNTPLPPSSSTTGCDWTEVTPNECPGATPLAVLGNGTLPVTLSSFSVQANNQIVQLIWTTSAEVNNKGFTIQRSANANASNWLDIGFLKGAGNSSTKRQYNFIDVAPLSGINYYRLAQTDLDGHVTYFQIESVSITSVKPYTLQRFTNGQYMLMVTASGQTEISIADVSGRRLANKIVSQGGYPLNISAYPAGMYLLQIKNGNRVQTEKLLKP